MIYRKILRLLGHQQWLRFGIRDRVIRAFHNPDKSLSESFHVSFYGVTYPGNFSTFIDWSTYYFGAYCKEELDLIQDSLRGIEDPIVLDIGANIGHHSLYASKFAKEVHSFEPYPVVASKIYEKIRINNISNIKVHEVGLGATNENLHYSPPTDCNTGTGSFANSSIDESSVLSLPIRKGDDYLKSLNLPKVDFIKMDIEGFEPQALLGLQKTLQSNRPMVFFEWSNNQRELTDDLQQLFPVGYKIFSFVSDQKFLGLFCKKGYSLIDNEKVYYDGNKVAIPEEKFEYIWTKKLKG